MRLVGFGPFFAFAAIAMMGAGTLANASAITYNDPVAWASAASGITMITFDGLALANEAKTYNTSTGYVIDGVDFTGVYSSSAYELEATDAGLASPFYNWGSSGSLVMPGWYVNAVYPYIQVTLPANTTAFGVDLATLSPNSLSYSITLSDGETFTTPTAARPTLTFFGVTSDSPISSVNFQVLDGTPGGTAALMDNFQFGQAQDPAQTPEACTLLMIGIGLVAMRWRYKRHKPAAVAIA